MTFVKRWMTCLAVLGLVLTLAPSVRAEAPADATKAAAAKPASKAAGPKDLLEAIPDEAWGFVAIPKLSNLDRKLGALSEQLNFPVDSPLMLAVGQLGIADGLREDGGLGVVVLDPTEYGTPPDMLVFLVPTTDSQALLEVFEPQDAGEGAMRIDIMGQELYAITKGGFVVLGPDKTSVKYVAEAKKGIRGTLQPGQIERYKKGDIFALLNLRPAIEMVKPLAGQVVAMLMMGAMDDDPTAGERIQNTAEEIVNLLDELSSLEVSLALDDDAVTLSIFLTFQEEGAITKKIASCDAKPAALLAGLPKDAYMLAVGVRGTAGEEAGESTLQQGLMELAMSRSEVGQVVDKEKMKETQKLSKALAAKMGNVGISVSVLAPAGGATQAAQSDAGMVGVTVVSEVDDVAGAMGLIRKLIESYKGVFKDEDMAKAMSSLTCKPDAEKVGDVSVDHISLDLAAAAGGDEQVLGALEVAKKVLGKEGMLIRVAPAGDKHIVATLGGGKARIAQAVKDASSGKSPLAEDEGVQKARKKMPKSRMAEVYVSVNQLLKAVKAITGSEEVPIMEDINAPLGISLSAEKNYGRLDVVLPMELVIEIKNVALSAIFGGGFGGGGASPSF